MMAEGALDLKPSGSRDMGVKRPDLGRHAIDASFVSVHPYTSSFVSNLLFA
jgi:hypothetical protein